MKKKLAMVLALSTVLMSFPAFAYDYPLKNLWTQEFGDPNQIAQGSAYTNMRALFDHVGNQDLGFDVDVMIDSPTGEAMMDLLYPFVVYSDPMGEDLLEYWKNYEGGVLKEMHNAGDEPNEWASFVPMSAYEEENADKLYPVIVVAHGGNDKKYTVETYGFVQYAAKTQEFIVIEPQDRAPEAVAAMLEVIAADYPADMTRVYMTGDSAGGSASLNNAAAHPDVFAAIAPFGIGAQIGGNMPQKINMGRYKMPIMYLYGTQDCYASMPVRDTERRSAADTVSMVNQWYAINECVIDPLTVETSAALVESSEDFVKKATGVDFTTTYSKEYPDLTYHFGETYDKDGVCMYTIVVAENGTHWHSASYAEIVWDYFKHFSREPETGKLIVE